MESEVCQFYAGRKVLVTGGTGYVGKCLVFKLLNDCPEIEKIYLLLRKKGQYTFEMRKDRYLNYDLFNYLKSRSLLEKLTFVEGCVDKKGLGLSEDVLTEIIEEVSIVFHSAASVDLEAGHKAAIPAANANLRGTMNILEVCQTMRRLACMVYVSTATAYHFRDVIEEKIYPVACTAEEFLSVIESGDKSRIERFLKEDKKIFPNAYTLTKALCENLCQAENGNIPICIVRPPIVSSAVTTPTKGWTYKMQAFNSLILLWVMGLGRCLVWDPDTKIQVVPLDYITNVIIASAWQVAKTAPDHVPVYNVVASKDKLVSWQILLESSLDVVFDAPSIKALRWPGRELISPKNPFKLIYSIIFQHIIFAMFSDLFLICTGNSPQVCGLMIKMFRTIQSVKWFVTKDWQYTNSNYLALYESLNETDKEIFQMSMETLDWKKYIHEGYFGLRKFVLHEDESNIKAAVARLRRLTILTNSAIAFSILLIIAIPVIIFLLV